MSLATTFRASLAGLGDLLEASIALAGSAGFVIDENIADGVTDKLLTGITIDISQLKAIVITSDQIVTLETNSPSAPQETFTIGPTTPLVWVLGAGPAVGAIFAGDVTAVYVTNASGAAAHLQGRIHYDATV